MEWAPSIFALQLRDSRIQPALGFINEMLTLFLEDWKRVLAVPNSDSPSLSQDITLTESSMFILKNYSEKGDKLSWCRATLRASFS
jgi:hypothetical protein